jgi:hypothetical protein
MKIYVLMLLIGVIVMVSHLVSSPPAEDGNAV